MKGVTGKYRLRFLMFFAFALTVCTGSAAETANKDVFTPIEQRMQKRVSVDFRNTPIEDVIRILAEQADVDIIGSPKVVGNVTATFTDVPLEEALNNILTAHGCSYVVDKNMIRVAVDSEITEKSERLVSRIYRITYANVKEVEEALRKFISSRGALSFNPGTSNIIVTDTESKIKAVDTFIEEIDRITPQILVEARIYDITSKDKLDLGIEWQGGRNTTYGTGGIPTIGTNPTGDKTPFITGTFSGATSKTSSVTGALRLGWLNNGVDIDAVLKAQQQNIDAKLLANPRILVLDNERALIKIVSEIPYQELSETSGGGSIGTTAFREVGVELEVTPHLTRDEMIRLRLKPKFSVKVGDITVGVSSNTFAQPIVDRREADTTLLIKNGQTVVLGGLCKKEVTKQINKVPVLGDLPLVGLLFRFEGEDTVNSELVVFVTPWLIPKPTMSQIELQQFEVTEFKKPQPTSTRAEAPEK